MHSFRYIAPLISGRPGGQSSRPVHSSSPSDITAAPGPSSTNPSIAPRGPPTVAISTGRYTPNETFSSFPITGVVKESLDPSAYTVVGTLTPAIVTAVLPASNGGCGHCAQVPPVTTIVSPPFVVSEVLKAAGEAQYIIEVLVQKDANEGCATPRMARGIVSGAGGFDATVLVTSHSATVERVASCAVSQAARNSMLERLPRTPEESIVIGEASMYVKLLFALHETEMISLPVAAAPVATVRRTVGVSLPVADSAADTFDVNSTYVPRGCVGAEVGALVGATVGLAVIGATVGLAVVGATVGADVGE